MTVEITDELADLALRTYVMGTGHSRDCMRKAIETVLGRLDATELLATGDSEDVRVDAAYQRGWTAGHAALDVLEQRKPTEYEVWRDALQLAVSRLGNAADSKGLIAVAEWFWERLDEVPVRAGVPD